jgi:hypothetical protein
MATSSINDRFVIKDEAALDRLEVILNKPSRFDNIKPMTDEKLDEGLKVAQKWLSQHSKN